MTGPSAPVTEPGPLRQVGRGIGRAAVLIGAITVLARVIGFGRQLVFAHTVGSDCLGTAYATANQVPNIVYDIVLGGALTSVVVPVLAGAAARRGVSAPAGPGPDADAEASAISSALLTWTVVVLAPVSLALALVAGPVTTLLLAGVPGCDRAAMAEVSARMLAIFAPQILLYGVAVVAYGVLQAHRRFTAPALAPVLSSLIVIGAYLAFLPLGHAFRDHVGGLSTPAELTLSVGTTAGVAALALTALGPALRLRLRLRPSLRFPSGVARRVRGLAAVGVVTLIAQDASLVAVIVLANGHGVRGALVLYSYAWQMFFVPYAVLAVPIVTSAFPVLSASAGQRFDATTASSTRAVMLVSWLGAALLAGVATPAARLFVDDPARAHQLALAFAAFAPGLVGYGLAANLSRVLLAARRSRVAAIGLVSGWMLVIAADLAAATAAPARWVVPALGLGNSIGLTAAALALLVAVRRARGPVALLGCGRAARAGLAGAVAAWAAGTFVSVTLPVTGFLPDAGVCVLACLAVAAVFGAVVLVMDGGDVRAMASRVAGKAVRWTA